MTLLKPLVPLACIAALGACATGLMPDKSSVTRGQSIFAKECSACHGQSGALETAVATTSAPDLTGLTARNDGAFPRAFVQRFVLGKIEKEDPDAAMPEFGTLGLKHAARDGSPAAEIPPEDMIALLDYIETLQK